MSDTDSSDSSTTDSDLSSSYSSDSESNYSSHSESNYSSHSESNYSSDSDSDQSETNETQIINEINQNDDDLNDPLTGEIIELAYNVDTITDKIHEIMSLTSENMSDEECSDKECSDKECSDKQSSDKEINSLIHENNVLKLQNNCLYFFVRLFLFVLINVGLLIQNANFCTKLISNNSCSVFYHD